MKIRSTTFVAPVTPLTASGDLNEPMIVPLCRVLIARGAGGFYVGGGTGEGMLMTLRQRVRLLEAWREAVGPNLPLIAHVSCVSMEDSRYLARHAAGLGVTAISSLGPTVFSPRDVGDLVRFLSGIMEAAPDTPFYYYLNGSVVGGLKVSGFDFLTAAQSSLPTLAGIKFTHEDLMDLSRCLRFDGGRYRIFFGKDEFLLGACAIGATNFIGGAFNVILPLARIAIDAFAAGHMEDARAAYSRLVDVIAVLRRFGGLSAVKATMEMFGVPCGPLLRPHRTCDERERASLFASLRETWRDIDAITSSATSTLNNTSAAQLTATAR